MHKHLPTQPASSTRQPQLGIERGLHTLNELVREQLLARHFVQSQQSPIKRLLQAGEEHGQVAFMFHPGRLEPPHSFLAVGRCVEPRCNSFLRSGPVQHPMAHSGLIQWWPAFARPLRRVLSAADLSRSVYSPASSVNSSKSSRNIRTSKFSKGCGHLIFNLVLVMEKSPSLRSCLLENTKLTVTSCRTGR
ncbi:hypothetical protein CSKR_102956 [Clonorchis sinensis]|uniref:Uncharacterized protein n=1 Tax=Clonorchis sinensis TaxID=79923 RepID=A0A3R7C7C1_CLOSI|nr:hypothetical protein CSKR_102956 [Clonorchis sinensis]